MKLVHPRDLIVCLCTLCWDWRRAGTTHIAQDATAHYCTYCCLPIVLTPSTTPMISQDVVGKSEADPQVSE